MKKSLTFYLLSSFVCAFSLSPSWVLALSIHDVVQKSIKTNPDVLAVQEQLESRKKEVRGAKAGRLPTLDGELGLGREWTKSPSTGNDGVELDRTEVALRLRQMLYDGRAVGSEIDRQQARYISALFNAEATKENVSLRAIEVFVEVLRQSELLQLIKSVLKEHENIYKQMELRSKAGVGSLSDLDQVAARLALARNNYAAGEGNLRDAVSNFYNTVGYVDYPTTLQPPKTLEVTGTPEESLEYAFINHPQLQSAIADIKAAEAQYKASKSSFHPTISLEGDRTWNEDIDGVEGKNEDWLLALRLRYRFYNGGASKARKDQTAYLLDEAKEVRNSTKRQVEQALRFSWHTYQSSKRQMEYLRTYVHAVLATREAYRKQFNIGKRTLLDLLNTENELLDARSNYLNASYDNLVASYRIYHSEGKLTNKLAIK